MVTEDGAHHRYAAVRLNDRTGSVTARVSLGARNPTALLAVDHEIWIASSDSMVVVTDG